MVMEAHVFWCYALAACALVWGALGLRFALSVLAANAVLAAVFFLLPHAEWSQELFDGNLGTALLLCYPIYWGVAFFVLRFIDWLPLPPLSISLRFAAGVLIALSLGVLANASALSRPGKLFYATYLSDPAKRHELLEEVFAESDYQQICLDSYAELMQLALAARDAEVTRVLLAAFDRCHSASATTLAVARPLFDEGDLAGIEFLLENGLQPSTLISGSMYKGTALAYAALSADQPSIVQALIAHNPEDARSLKYLSVIVKDLKEQHKDTMLRLFAVAGIADPAEEPFEQRRQRETDRDAVPPPLP